MLRVAGAFEEFHHVVEDGICGDVDVVLPGKLQHRAVEGVDFSSLAGKDVLERGRLVFGGIGHELLIEYFQKVGW